MTFFMVVQQEIQTHLYNIVSGMELIPHTKKYIMKQKLTTALIPNLLYTISLWVSMSRYRLLR